MRRTWKMLKIIGAVVSLLSASSSVLAANLVSSGNAPHRGVYEVVLTRTESVSNPYTNATLVVTFKRPDNSQVTVDGFYDGNNSYKARAYCDKIGIWTWTSQSNMGSLNAKKGSFSVVASSLKGKLRIHPSDSRQFAYDNGDWFLHIGDTGYRYVCAGEPLWQEYIDQAAQMGATKIRTWFNDTRSNVQGLWKSGDRTRFNLAYWQEIDRRVTYGLNTHPDLILQLIPFGEDSTELSRYNGGDANSKRMMQYVQARFSSFANVHWCIANDRDMNNSTLRSAVEKIGTDAAAREPWGTLITSHQTRSSGYRFTNAAWSDIITLETLDEVAGPTVLRYYGQGNDPVVMDEDRYELYRAANHRRYFFRRLMWGCLLSGGSATYGGLKTYELHDGGLTRGVRGYYNACDDGTLEKGAHDFNRIHTFFEQYDIDLVGMSPDDAFVGSDPKRRKCLKKDDRILIYFANPTGTSPGSDNESSSTTSVTVNLPNGNWKVDWFDPYEGGNGSQAAGSVAGGNQSFTTPSGGDWLLLLRTSSTPINNAPATDAGASKSVTLPNNTVALDATVTDDGLPNDTLSYQWNKVSGPGTVSFSAAASEDTDATFGAAGEYVLRLTASDGELSTSDDVTVTVVTPTKVFIIGDSITQGNTSYNSYRRPLWHALNNAGYAINFVGSTTSNHGGAAPNPDFDLDHEGHWGWRADEILAQINGWAAAAAPDISLIHLGSNDLIQGQSVSSTITELGGIIDALRTANADVTILLAQIIPNNRCSVTDLNTAIATLATQKSNANSSVIAVDHHTGFALTNLHDGVHPNVAGEQEMANRWYQALAGILNSGGIYEAEEAVLSGPAVSNTRSGYTGAGYADYVSASGGYIEWTVTVAQAGQYDLAFRYSLPASNRPLRVTVNGTIVDDSLDFPATADWDSWSTVTVTADLNAGSNTVRTTAIGSSGGNIDSLTVTTAEVPVENQAPVVDAGAGQSIVLPQNTVSLDATATDDSLPVGSTLATQWTMASGTGIVTFGDATAIDTTAEFSASGTYVLRLEATDGELTTSDSVTITVTSEPIPGSVYEAELAAFTGAAVASTHSGFTGTGYVDYAGSSGAYIEWIVNVAQAGSYELKFRYAMGAGNRPLRVSVNGSVVDDSLDFPSTGSWASWGTVTVTADLDAGSNTVRTTTIGSSGGNLDSLAVTAVDVVNQAPIVDAGLDQTIVLPENTATLDASVTDDALPAGSVVVVEWTMISGPGSVTFEDETAIDTTAEFSDPGTYVLQLEATDGELTSSDLITVTLNSEPAPSTVYEAEDAAFSGASLANTHSGYTGNGYVDYASSSGAYIEWTVNVPQAGSYQLTFRYALGASNRPLRVSVNGLTVDESLDFPGTGGWANWGTVTVTVDLAAGSNTARTTAIGSSGGNLDSLTVGN